MPKTLSWKDVAKVRTRWKGPLFVKGILNIADVDQALDSGIDGVMLGSHGGRQADSAISALDILPAVRERAGDRLALYISGGIRRGSDVIKAMGLGADAVLAGRALLYGLCAHGVQGVERALTILHDETLNEMGQLGISALDQSVRALMVRKDDLRTGRQVFA
jgi:(S)-mandelate dehydrogenase